ncbi:alpha-ketoacid dehydrogenase subunit beta [Hyphomonas sp.]|jgi:pyruvate/2-oxoglutarate/acetoin dehydrogenase E1 component|uniref:alpha-ketoacid dehydrogenase subunit beta n=1 Tax=Hyphomonas sp. TaxID=87 RepID=UPI000C5AD245|nr:alpha-ketoacid dehydrogenase subunit beta [Hyphomonas sp.]MAB10828.1 alpha-ketoacid dehydrogenase subunit beta [Hyphomonas sp.]MAU66240.1 alpha-ketoacid dehydrogenase subunit beta [Hyphomonas sp.]MBM59494.1 alpha-ketoacid dehydrogenase subunit beta [Hyphomonas sp.]
MEKKRKLTIAKAMSEAIALEMRASADVLVMGEDIAKLGGVFGNTQGLLDEFGPDRVRDTPISETAFIGTAVGMAAAGMKPVVELMFVDFFGVCMDAIYNLAAKQSYFSGGNVTCPMVLMTSVGGGYGDAGQHSQTLFATFGHLPGLKVVIPSNAHDAKGMMAAAISDPNPVVFMFHKALQGMGWLGTVPRSITHVPEERYTIALDRAHIVREGRDITLVGLGHTVHLALDAAAELEGEGIEAEVIDLRSIAPLDRETILASVARTGALISVDDDYHSYGVGAEILATVAEQDDLRLKVPPKRISYPDIPVPFAPEMEHFVLPNADKIVTMARKLLKEGANV